MPNVRCITRSLAISNALSLSLTDHAPVCTMSIKHKAVRKRRAVTHIRKTTTVTTPSR